MTGPQGGTQTGEELSAQILQDLTRASQPLPQKVELGRVRALRTSQITQLVREALASEIATWQKRVASLEQQLAAASDERSETTRHELPRLAGLIEVERSRADGLQQELETLREQLAEVDAQPVAVASSDAELGQLKERIAELEAALLTLEAHDDPALALFEEYGDLEARNARLTLLEDLVWEIEEGRDTGGTQRRTLEELRSRLEGAQRERQEAAENAREVKFERDRLLMTVRELQDAREQGKLEVATLMTRYSALEEALAAAEARVSTAESIRAAEIAESQVLAGQVGKGALREKELREELEDKSRRELKLRRQISQLEARLAAEPAQPPPATAIPPAADLLGVPDSVLDDLRLGTRVLSPDADLGRGSEDVPGALDPPGEFTAELSVEVPEAEEGSGEAFGADPIVEALTDELALAQGELEALRQAYAELRAQEPDPDAAAQAQEATAAVAAQAEELVALREAFQALEAAQAEPNPEAAAALTEAFEGQASQLAAAQLEADELRAAYQALTGDMQVAKAAYSERSEALECELEAVRGALADAKAANQILVDELAVARGQLTATQDGAVSQVGEVVAEREALTRERDALADELGSARRAYKSVREVADRLEAQLTSALRSLAESRQAESGLTSMLDTVEEALEQRLGAAEAVFEDLKGVRSRSEKALADRDAKLRTLREELRVAKAAQQAAEAALAQAQTRARVLEESLDETKQRADTSSTRADDLELELAVVRGTLEGAKSSADMLRDAALKAEESREAVENELRSTAAETSRLDQELADVREALATAQRLVAEERARADAAERARDEQGRAAAQSGGAEAALAQVRADADRERRESLELLRAAERELEALRAAAAEEQAAHEQALNATRDELQARYQESLTRLQAEASASHAEGLELLKVAEREIEALRAEQAELARLRREEKEQAAAAGSHAEAESGRHLRSEVSRARQEGLELLKAAEREIEALKAEKEQVEEALSAQVQELIAQLEAGGLDPEAEPAASVSEPKLARLSAEVKDLERLLESECWRGLATHRDLVHAHERIRQLEEQLSEGEEPAAEAAPEILGEQRQAIDWLVKGSPNPEFAPEARRVLPELEETVHQSRRYLRRMREEFQAERKGLLEGALTAERALENARGVGVSEEQFAVKSRRATERLRKFDSQLETELKMLEETLHDQENARLWLMREVGGPLREAESELLVEAKAALAAIEAEVGESERKRHDIERDALLAMQSLEEERASLATELDEARRYGEGQATQRMRLEDSIRQLQDRPAVGLADKVFVKNAERVAVLSAQLDDRESVVHWLMRELDADYQHSVERGIAECLSVVREAPGAADRTDLLRWLGVRGDTPSAVLREAALDVGSQKLRRGDLNAADLGFPLPVGLGDGDPYTKPPSDELEETTLRERGRPATETLRPWAEDEEVDEDVDNYLESDEAEEDGGSGVW